MSGELRIPDAERLQAALVAYADGAFGEKDRARAEALLEAHPELRERVATIRRDQAQLRGVLRGEAAPAGLDPIRRGRIALAARRVAAQRASPWRSPALLAAACLVLAVLGGLLLPTISMARRSAREAAPIRVLDLQAPSSTAAAADGREQLEYGYLSATDGGAAAAEPGSPPARAGERFEHASPGPEPAVAKRDVTARAHRGRATREIEADDRVERPLVTQLVLPVEGVSTESEAPGGMGDSAKGREEAVVSSEVGGEAAFMAIGAGGGLSGSFGRSPAGSRLQTDALEAEAVATHFAGGLYQVEPVRERRLDGTSAPVAAGPALVEPPAGRTDALHGKLAAARAQNEHARAEVLANTIIALDPSDPAAQRGLVAARKAQAVIRHNPWTLAAEDALSTFALDTDVASYAIARRQLRAGALPDPASVRTEAFVNAFDQAYPSTGIQTFAVHATAAPAPFGPAGSVLLKLGVKGRVVGRDQQRPAHLVFVVDASGSMGTPDRLPLLRHGLERLLESLGEHDRITVIATAAEAHLVVDHRPAAEAAAILAALDRLQPAGGTNLLAGLEQGYAQAAQHFRAGAVNQLLLCSDGVATIGPDDAAAVLAQVGSWREQGIGCTSIGVGAGAYDDRMLARLAKDGDGHYHYLDSEQAAEEIFVRQLGATLHGIARDARIQVAFDPQRVRRYRLLGYEQREIADADFRNDAVDAGEVGSGQSATALYELELVPGHSDLGQVALRWEDLDGGDMRELSYRLPTSLLQASTPSEDPRFHLAACAAEFAEILRRSPHAADGGLDAVARRLDAVVAALPLDPSIAELRDLVRRAGSLVAVQP